MCSAVYVWGETAGKECMFVWQGERLQVIVSILLSEFKMCVTMSPRSSSAAPHHQNFEGYQGIPNEF
jgi:hypothetical protein